MTAPFVISRIFDAPRDRVWKAWTEAERMKQWWAPKGFTCTHCTVDLRPGGVVHYCLRSPEGNEMWGKYIYREIVKPEKLVFVVSFSDAKGGITVHPMNPNWPREILSTVAFQDLGGKTKLTVQWTPHDTSTDLERKTFEDGRDGMKMGWTGTLDYLTEYFARG